MENVERAQSFLTRARNKLEEARRQLEHLNYAESVSAAQESAEIGILEPYLPKMLSREEIAEVARAAIAEVGASSPKQVGQVMRVLMPRVHGQADGRLVNEVVKKLLSGKTG